MEKLVLIDGNSIANRAFYGIMGSKMLMTNDGKYTNAVYGFLAILFKILEDIKPEYMVVAFDLKAPTARHKAYEGYKANRHGMPNELAEQMPIIKQVLKAMNIDIVEKEGYEADDVLGTLAKYGERQGLDVTILSGDRDTFQLVSKNIKVRIPRTKMGKTETEDFDEAKIQEVYGLKPKQLIEVKALQGDSSDNIPGVPGIGEKTALSLIQKYDNIENLYSKIENNEDDLKGKQREKIAENKELAFLSKFLGTINLEVPIEDKLEQFKVEEWDKAQVLNLFKVLKFNRFIERFNLQGNENSKENVEEKKELYNIIEIDCYNENYNNKENDKNNRAEKNKINQLEELKDKLEKSKSIFFNFTTKKIENNDFQFISNEENDKNSMYKIINEKIVAISIYIPEENVTYYIKRKNNVEFHNFIKNIFENNEIEKYGYNLTKTYILLKQESIEISNLKYDAEIAAYILNPTQNKNNIKDLAMEYLNLDIDKYLSGFGVEENKIEQINLFDMQKMENQNENEKKEKYEETIIAYSINQLYNTTLKKLEEINAIELFNNIDMPTVEVLSDMQWNGMKVDIEELDKYGEEIKEKIDVLTKEIHQLAGEEFNINSTKQLGEVLFEKLKLPIIKKNKSGYSTDVDVLEKLREEHPIIEKLLEYRQVMKLNSTYVEGLKPYINPKTKRIHSFFHQTITATGRISSTEPNLQNIPTRMELGKRVRRVFKPDNGKIYIDADYSQIELRVLAHISEDKHMIEAFKNGEDIHKQAASKVLNIPIEEVTKEQRSNAKAVNFGIVYGISDFGLGGQLGISRKKAKEYIEQYLSEYNGIKEFMDNITETAKEKGYVETLFKRRRYIPEISSNNFMVRQFGARAAMNTPIQGTAADIMKIAMISVYRKLKENKLKSKIVLQVHDEMMLECFEEEKEQIKNIIKESMENAIELKVPLIAEISEANNWYDCK